MFARVARGVLLIKQHSTCRFIANYDIGTLLISMFCFNIVKRHYILKSLSNIVLWSRLRFFRP